MGHGCGGVLFDCLGGGCVDDITLLHGDCFERMKEIEDGSVALVIADPPYNIGVQTKTNGKKKTKRMGQDRRLSRLYASILR